MNAPAVINRRFVASVGAIGRIAGILASAIIRLKDQLPFWRMGNRTGPLNVHAGNSIGWFRIGVFRTLRARPMARRTALVTQAEANRLFKAAYNAGYSKTRFVVHPNGRFELEAESTDAKPSEKPLDRWVRDHG